MIDFSHLWPMVDKGGLMFVLFLTVYAFVKGWVVPRWVYDKTMRESAERYLELKENCDRMTHIALRTTELSERSVAVGEKIVRTNTKVLSGE